MACLKESVANALRNIWLVRGLRCQLCLAYLTFMYPLKTNIHTEINNSLSAILVRRMETIIQALWHKRPLSCGLRFPSHGSCCYVSGSIAVFPLPYQPEGGTPKKNTHTAHTHIHPARCSEVTLGSRDEALNLRCPPKSKQVETAERSKNLQILAMKQPLPELAPSLNRQTSSNTRRTLLPFWPYQPSA